ncbi:FRG domain-containing protein [Microbulbifer sp. VTAC004]|uniref:FRG domain-containing protein n=1 Tax=Microbulbifer sp. VTAC004 TaxID=3243386 RepID=UPI004039F71B
MDNYDFERIPLWNGEQSDFDILSDEVNGRIPVTRLESWKNFAELLETSFFNRPKTQLIFRGHRRYDWGLMPTLARVPESGVIDRKLADSQLDYFKRAVRGRLADNALVSEGEEDELWSVGQHHGLMTPLLDWTYSPYVALFFAFSKEDSEEEKENPYRAIYVLNKTFVADDDLCPDVRMFEPRKDDHGRLVNQAGLFTFSPYDSTIENKLIDTLADENFPDDELRNATLSVDTAGEVQEEQQAGILAKYICKIYIKNEDREGCMRYLRRMNVHHASLFPDLIGASEYCNLLVAEERREYEFELSAKRVVEKTSQVESEPAQAPIQYETNNSEVLKFARALSKYANTQVEPGRIQFIAEHLSKELKPLLVIDWKQRDPAIAKIRSAIRINLRKYGYPADSRDSALNELIESLMTEENIAETEIAEASKEAAE